MDTIGIFVENHQGRRRAFLIGIRFHNMKLHEKKCLPQLLEDFLISETSPLEKNASHHVEVVSFDELGAEILGALPLADGEGVRSTLLI